MKLKDVIGTNQKGINIFLLVLVTFIALLVINISFYPLKESINYFDLIANSILSITTLYLIFITQKHSESKSGFYYYTSIGFAFIFFGLLVLSLSHVFTYQTQYDNIASKILFVFGYSLLAFGVTKWIKFNAERQSELSIQANTDELTNVLNRRSFTSYLQYEYKKAHTISEPFSLLILDIDFFKNINDTYGHLVGDEILKNMGTLLKSFFRSADKACRWGGEEFAILLPETSLNNAMTVADKLRKKIENEVYYHEGKPVKYTVSIGVSESLSSDADIESIIGRADDALYQAKNNNRNCVQSVRA